jgi:TolA-binding protein
MTVISFHPEDLLDREMRGTILPEEQERLDRHLASCGVCRFERQVRADFEEELAQPDALPDLALFVRGALQNPAEVGLERRTQNVVRSTARMWSTRRRTVMLLAAALTLGSGLAAANTEMVKLAWQTTRIRLASPSGPLGWLATKPRAATTLEVHAASQPAASPNASPAAVMVPAEELSRDAPLGVPQLEAKPHLSARAPHRSVEQAVPTAAREPIVVSATPPLLETPASFFERANAARRKGNSAEAATVYRDLESRFPRSAEARLSVALLARLQLDRGEAQPALAGFTSYLAQGDRSLREESMAGRAMALGRLGRSAEASQAWRDLLQAYPTSGYATVAKKHFEQEPR